MAEDDKYSLIGMSDEDMNEQDKELPYAPSEISFYSGICIALQVVYDYDNETIWQSIVRSVNKIRVIKFAKEIEPVNWELCGFHKWFKE
jgi:hypothetical protein